MTKRVLIDEFERYIELSHGRLGFGCSPKGKDGLESLVIDKGVNLIVNLRHKQGKFDPLWYVKLTRAKVVHIPLEEPKELLKDDLILEKARQVVGMMKKDPKTHVFIHGTTAYDYTSVFALLCWVLSGGPKDPLGELREKYGDDLTRDFPSQEVHRTQLMRIVNASKRDIFAAFDRGSLKKQKIHVVGDQDHPNDAGGDVHDP